MLQIPGGPEIIILLVVVGIIGAIGLVGLILFRSLIRGYNDGKGYSEK